MSSAARITRVKICCNQTIEEAWMAIRHGASAVGLVSAMPSGPGPISEETIAEIAAALPPAVGSFLLTSKQDAASIVAQQKRCAVNTIQFVDRLPIEAYAQLRQAMPGIALVQVVHVMGQEAIAEAREVAPQVDGILLDSGNPTLPRKELGGTGRTHDWEISRQIVQQVKVPVFLAGGLRPHNVAQAIQTVQPFAVDVCGGVRSGGRLDQAKLAALFAAVRRAEQ